MNTLAFTVNFMVWTMFAVIGVKIKSELNLNETEFGLLVATPILTGSLVRLPLGLLTDRYGGRTIYFVQMLLVAVSTYGLVFADQYWQYLAIGLCIGLAGGSFAIGIAYTSAWFQQERQGTAMGIFGAGNAGAAVTNLVAPLIVVAMGWRMVPQIYSLTMLVMAILFLVFTYPDPQHERRKREQTLPTLGAQLDPLADIRVWRLGLAYYFVFGGFVALALWLPKYYISEYGLDLKSASFIALFFTLPAGVIRALGGWFSDRWGGNTVTWWAFWVSIICLFLLAYPPTTFTVHGITGDISLKIAIGVTLFTVLVFIVGVAQGIGTASVYRSIADYYPANMGAVGGLVGVIGGLGGFSLPIMFGIAADATDVRSSTFMLMFAVLAGVMIWTWTTTRRERQDILAQDVSLRDQMFKDELLEKVKARGPWLRNWRPEEDAFWKETGRAIALRNLFFSMPPLLLSFAVWMLWSVVVIELPRIGFQFTTSELFWLAGAPGVSGAALRLAYAFVVPVFGGRNWTVFSTASLLIPTLWMSFAVQDPSTDYVVFLAIALLCGLGGGNFSASMANISFFFPKRIQGTALGWNAGVGNLGVGIVQLVVPLVIFGGAFAIKGGEPQPYAGVGTETQVWLQNAAYTWVLLILAATFAAAWGMNNIQSARATFAEQVVVFHHLARKHAWLLAWLYTGTFGSFIGFAAAFPILLSALFPDSAAFKWAFAGPLIGALGRPFGGWLADRLGGARVTFWTFAVMLVAAVTALFFLPSETGGSGLAGFFAAFMVLFIAAGIGNGSVFRVVPTVFIALHRRWAEGRGQAVRAAEISTGEIEASVALGFTASVAALGLFFIPAMVAISIETTGRLLVALAIFVVFYATCMFVTWWWDQREGAEGRCD